MPTYTTSAEAMQRMVATIKEHAPLIPGLRPNELSNLSRQAINGHLSVDWRRANFVECSLSVRMRATPRNEWPKGSQFAGEMVVEVSWSSTHRTAIQVVACAALYSQVAQFACLLESIAGSMEIADVTP